MNIFNYLMNKKGHEIFNNDDILSYLLKKGRVHKASGTEINIKNVKGFESLTLSKLSTQDGTPTPDNPVEVNTVKGYRNLFDGHFKSSVLSSGHNYTNEDVTRNLSYEDLTDKYYSFGGYFKAGTYTFSVKKPNFYISLNRAAIAGNNCESVNNNIRNSYTWTQSVDGYTYFSIERDASATVYTDTNFDGTDFMILINSGDTQLPYVPYGTNYIYTTITDGTNSRNVTIPLNDNEICGIGDYKDELVIDKYGHAKLTKKIGKVVLDGTTDNKKVSSVSYSSSNQVYYCVCQNACLDGTTFTEGRKADNLLCTHFIPRTTLATGVCYRTAGGPTFVFILTDQTITTEQSANTWLSTHNVELYYPLATPTEIDLGNIDMELYEGTNNITNSEDMDMLLEYYK